MLIFLLVFIYAIYIFLIRIDESADLGLYHFITYGFKKGSPDSKSIFLILLVLALFILVIVAKIVLSKITISLSFHGKRLNLIISIVYHILTVAAIVYVCMCFYRDIPTRFEHETEIAGMRTIFNDQKCVVHACGMVEYDDYLHTYTNSVEAINNCYDMGNRISEVDFMMTSDNKLVCAHDGGAWAYGIEANSPLTEAEFLDRKFENIFQTMGLTQLAEFLYAHPDLIIVTDIKLMDSSSNINGCKQIAERYPDLLDRFVIQIYHISEYQPIHDMGFKYIIFTLYETEPEERTPEELTKVIHNTDLVGITVWENWQEENFFEAAMDTGIPIFLHTVDDEATINNYLDKGLLVYTNDANNNWMRGKDQ